MSSSSPKAAFGIFMTHVLNGHLQLCGHSLTVVALLHIFHQRRLEDYGGAHAMLATYMCAQLPASESSWALWRLGSDSSESSESLPSSLPSWQPSCQPSWQPSCQPSWQPSCQPSWQPSCQPSCQHGWGSTGGRGSCGSLKVCAGAMANCNWGPGIFVILAWAY